MPVQCISFDLDDTLWECDSVIARAEHALVEWLNAHMPAIFDDHSADTLVGHRRSFAQTQPDISFDITEMRKRWLRSIAAEYGYDDIDTEVGFRIFWEKRNEVALFDGVTPMLERLSRTHTVGAITNGNADVHFIGIGHLFDYAISAADAKAAKPDPAIFQLARSRSECAFEQTLHVGDDPVRDIQAAQRLGMKTAWINPDLAPWPGGATPDLVLRKVTDLEAALDTL